MIKTSKLFETNYNETKITVVHGSIIELKVDAIVNAANSLMKMGGGVAKVIKNAAGQEVEDEAINAVKKMGGLCPIGKAILTSAGKLESKIKYIIHAPTMNKPVEPSSLNRIKSAVRGVMQRVYESNLKDPGIIKSVAFPAMGTGAGKIPKNKAAQAIVDGLINYFNTTVNVTVDSIILCDINGEQASAFKDALINSIN
ncbi:MAG: macro domain-containing protein [Candidatus Helarchaeota archaeon]|nr:macro domain-containing protein [Candidatus Helarchaeota archaeon]